MNKQRLCSLTLLAALVFAAPRAQGQNGWVLEGTVVTPETVLPGYRITIEGDRISDVSKSDGTTPPGKFLKLSNDIILPGMVDLHNHITWNFLPAWQHAALFNSRYDWQQVTDYLMDLPEPREVLLRDNRKHWSCEMNLFGEVKAVVNGETSLVGGLVGPDSECSRGLARNLDGASGIPDPKGGKEKQVYYQVFPLRLSPNDTSDVLKKLADGTYQAAVFHLAEGKAGDASSHQEFQSLDGKGLLVPKVILLHGVALGPPEFARMKHIGVSLVWSPKSNLDLYGTTADVIAARTAGVPTALAPDWSPSGSNGSMDELKFARRWSLVPTLANLPAGASPPPVFNDAQLVNMVTTIPAKMASLSGDIGSIAPHALADLLVLRNHGSDSYRAIIEATPADVELVVIGGIPVYGDYELMKSINGEADLQKLEICGSRKALDLKASGISIEGHVPVWGTVYEELRTGLARQGLTISSLAACHP